jgi:translocation protein SEC63
LTTKAYEALTDEVAKANYEKYGNPDGPGAMQMAIGLPSFLLDKENRI